MPVFLRACKDPVPNVRFCVAKMLREMMDKLDSSTVSKVKAVLTELINDIDKDVQYYAKKALNS